MDAEIMERPAARAPITISVFRKDGGSLSKSIALGEEGRPVSDGGGCRMSTGRVQTVRLHSIQELADLIGKLDEADAIALGAVRDDALDNEDCARVVRHADLPDDPGRGTIARTLDYIGFRAGQPGLMLLDYDTKGLPEAVAERIRAEGLEAVLAEVVPEIATTARLWRPSTSSGLCNSETGETFDKAGGHLFLAVTDAADITRATKALHQRLWLAGLGFILVGRAGQCLERSVIDVAVGSPERLVFEGPPQIVPPLVQSPRPCTVTRGKLLDLRNAIPDLSPDESATFERMLADAKAEADVIAAPIRKKVDDAEVRTLRKAGMDEGEARSRVEARRKGRLFPHVELHFDNGDTPTVAEVLVNPAAYHQETLADPIEPDTGRCRAKLYLNGNGSVVIHTFARGGAAFRLVADRRTIEAAIANADPTNVLRVVKRLCASAELTPTDYSAIIAATALRGGPGCGKRDVRQELDAALKEAQAGRADMRQDRGRGDADDRVVLDVPPPGGEFGPTLRAVDKVLCAVDDLEPPFRLADGHFGIIREQAPAGLHMLLTEAEAHSRSGDGDQSFIPAPAQAALVAAEYTDVALEVEKHVRFMRHTKEGDSYPQRLPEAHGKAYLGWAESNLPRVAALVTLPLVLPGRELFTGVGLNRERQVIFRIPPELLSHMPRPDEVNLDYAIDCLDWLFHEWLVDVEADPAGKAVIIAMTAQTIQRHLLPERPAYVVDAGQRGGGKTTTVIMSHIAVTGVRPAAAAWADDPNERRKALFASFMTGAAMIPFDNIGRGTPIRCPHIEASLTAAEKTDRVLSESRIASVPTTSTLVFTGNNITPTGDMASRTLRVSLEIDRPDPENRIFKHPDPIGWTLGNRGEILNAIYSILLAPGKRPAAETRFKTWHQLIGAPIELVFNAWACRARIAGRDAPPSLSFQDMLRGNEDEDMEAEGARELFNALWDRFPNDGPASTTTRCFKGGDFAAMLEYPAKPDPIDTDTAAYAAERQNVDRLRGALGAALGGVPLNGRITAHNAGHRLGALRGRSVSDGSEVMTLRKFNPSEGTLKKGSASYFIERRAAE
jgi:hypothetical protein